MRSRRPLLAFGARASTIAALVVGAMACNELVGIHKGTPLGEGGGTTGSGGSGGAAPACGDTKAKIDKLDLLLAIDNSRGMADKQQLLALAVSAIVKGLVNPPCVDPATGEVKSYPATPMDTCLGGAVREIDPVTDMHIGIVSSSLGAHGADACPSVGPGKQSNNDMGHLISRKDPSLPDQVETYNGRGFLAWDPGQVLAPPGEADIATDSPTDANATALVPTLRDMIVGVGQIGCGYESQLESWYRFLIEPEPYESISLDNNQQIQVKGTDNTLLAQRNSFLRLDSMLVVVMLTDENDCSIKESGQYYFSAQQKTPNGSPFHLPKGRAICDQDPNNECCFSCGQTGPKDAEGNPKCPADDGCKDANGGVLYLDETTDNINLRCWNEKRRFGIDFLYPVDRYVAGLTSCTVTNRAGEVVPNPIFADPNTADNLVLTRDPSMVFLMGIVGVPWQDIARRIGNGAPSLKTGLDPEGKALGGFKRGDELTAKLADKGYSTWDLILGDPSSYPAANALPRDPLMIESIDPRTGVNPITGDGLGPKGQNNAINGNEWTIPKHDDLQYACVFPLIKVDQQNGNVTPDTRDCSVPGKYAGCDCEDKTNDNPLCQAAMGGNTDQVKAKAYPGLRELSVVKGLGSQGAVGSVCPAQDNKPTDADFGYRPVSRTLTEIWKQRRK